MKLLSGPFLAAVGGSWLLQIAAQMINLSLLPSCPHQAVSCLLQENYHITNAVATFCHFLLDAVCAFVCVVMVTEITKFAAGRLRPDFLSVSSLPGPCHTHMGV